MTQETPDRLATLAALYTRTPLLGYLQPLTDEEWLRRFDAHIKIRSGYEGNYSEDSDREAALMYREDEGYKEAPEDAADEEMSNWEPPA
jgi:hypothetical protein